jgi:hypothetical protein
MSIHVSSDQILQPLFDESLVLSIEEMADVASKDVSKDCRNPQTFSIHHIGQGVLVPTLLPSVGRAITGNKQGKRII